MMPDRGVRFCEQSLAQVVVDSPDSRHGRYG